jgi:hypothetical protein
MPRDAQRRGYEALRATVDGLQDAFAETARSKGEEAAGLLDEALVQRDLDEADRLAGEGQYHRAEARLRKAYTPLVQALATLRANETVEHRLVFDSPAAELEYETRRFDSSLLLLELMVRERTPGADSMRRIGTLTEQARQLHGQARAQAGAGDLDAAIRSAEAATNRLNQALRHAGVYFAPQ